MSKYYTMKVKLRAFSTLEPSMTVLSSSCLISGIEQLVQRTVPGLIEMKEKFQTEYWN